MLNLPFTDRLPSVELTRNTCELPLRQLLIYNAVYVKTYVLLRGIEKQGDFVAEKANILSVKRTLTLVTPLSSDRGRIGCWSVAFYVRQ